MGNYIRLGLGLDRWVRFGCRWVINIIFRSWDLFMSGVVINIMNTLTGKEYSSLWVWAINFNNMLASSILWIVFLFAVIALAIIIIA